MEQIRFDTPPLKKSKHIFDEKSESYETWQYTSKWGKEQLEKLNIKFVTTDKEEEFFKEDFDLLKDFDISKEKIPHFQDVVDENLTRQMIIDGKDDENLSLDTQTMFSLMCQVDLSIRRKEKSPETLVDNMFTWLLSALGFGVGGLEFTPKPKISFEFTDIEIISESDFGVRKNNNNFEFILITESKNPRAKIKRAIPQIAGDTLIFAINEYISSRRDVRLYVVKVRGFDVTFFRVVYPKEYLAEVDRENVLNVDIIINELQPTYDIIDAPERKEFAIMMAKIRYIIKH